MEPTGGVLQHVLTMSAADAPGVATPGACRSQLSCGSPIVLAVPAPVPAVLCLPRAQSMFGWSEGRSRARLALTVQDSATAREPSSATARWRRTAPRMPAPTASVLATPP
jgi:hypothetical protein